jgi:branched-chain amino acid transport system ATP-binding protein
MAAELVLHSVSAGYAKRMVLREVSAIFPAGTRTLIIGANGSGKSTLLKAAFRLLPLIEGDVSLEGENLASLTVRDLVGRGMALMPQGGRLFENLTVAENLRLACPAGRQGNLPVGQIVEQYFPRMLDDQRRLARSLSGGERQILSLAMALARQPRCLLLDEPTHGLAQSAEEAILDKVDNLQRDNGFTLIMVEHRILSALRIVDRVLALRRGRVLDLIPAAEVNDAWLSEVFLG